MQPPNVSDYPPARNNLPPPFTGWHAVWLLAQGWTASATGEALERDPHTIGPFDKLRRASAFGEGGPAALIFEQTGGSPPPPSARNSRRS